MMPSDSSHNLPIFSVGELSNALKRAVEEGFARVRVRGEISGFKRAASGHLYLALKDTDAVLDGVCWRGTASKLGLDPEDGMEVIASGRLTTYAGRSKYQIVIDHMELAGEGALLKLLEERRKKLAGEGLFDESAKQPLPFLPEVIGVVTSPTGAVIKDILHRLADRFPRRVLLWPVLVQGDGAAGQIAQAIRGFGSIGQGGPVPRPDVLIVARGGGSIEDLWAFNEEAVVRAAFECPIPVISAVGHETDTTLIDFAADRRAPTPTAAAEMAVPVRRDLLAELAELGGRLGRAVERLVEQRRSDLTRTARGLPNLTRLVDERGQRLDEWSERFGQALKTGHERRRARFDAVASRLIRPDALMRDREQQLASEARALHGLARTFGRAEEARLGQLSALLESYSYQRVLDRGFALVTNTEGRPVTSAGQTQPGDVLDVRFKDGVAQVTVAGDGAAAKPAALKRVKAARKQAKDDDAQGQLL